MAQLLVSLVGSDREGLVQEISTVVAEHDGNWLESQLARLGGSFAGVALVDVPDERIDEFTGAAEALTDLQVRVTPAGEDQSGPSTPVVVHLVGNDRHGIVREITRALATQKISIDEMTTSTRPAPMADTTLFEATARLRVPQHVAMADVRRALEAVAADLMVDLDLDETVDA